MQRAYVSLIAAFILLELADLVITLCGISMGAQEGNPLMSHLFFMPVLLAGVKLAVTALAAAVLVTFKYGARRMQLVGMGIAGYGCIVCAAALTHNVVLLASLTR